MLEGYRAARRSAGAIIKAPGSQPRQAVLANHLVNEAGWRSDALIPAEDYFFEVWEERRRFIR